MSIDKRYNEIIQFVFYDHFYLQSLFGRDVPMPNNNSIHIPSSEDQDGLKEEPSDTSSEMSQQDSCEETTDKKEVACQDDISDQLCQPTS